MTGGYRMKNTKKVVIVISILAIAGVGFKYYQQENQKKKEKAAVEELVKKKIESIDKQLEESKKNGEIKM